MGVAGTSWCHDRYHDIGGMPRQDVGRHAGVRRLARLQRRQPNAHSGPLDADSRGTLLRRSKGSDTVIASTTTYPTT